MRAEKVGAETLLAQIVQMVSDASRSRAPIQKLADRVSAWFVPAVIVVAMIAFAVWGLTGQTAGSPTGWSPRYPYSSSLVPVRWVWRRPFPSWSASDEERERAC